VSRVRILTQRDVNIEELSKSDVAQLPDEPDAG
jgi:hypothetical protein